mgnify:CR=1 FL=1
MNPLYSLAGILASAGLHLAACFHEKARLIVRGRRETPERLRRLEKGRRVVWFHASSLGEFEQGRPLMEAWREAHPEWQILLSFFSPSGYEVRRDYAGADVVVYLPSDRSSSVRRFLDLAHPAVAIFIKYDFWPTMLSELATRSIPTYLVSAIFRPDQLFFRSYGGWYLRLLHLFRRLYVQDEASRTLLVEHGVESVKVTGDTRFDRVEEIARAAKDIPAVAELSRGRRLLVVGSSWPEDEAILLPYFNEEAPEDFALVLAPHEIHEEHLRAIEAQLTRPAVRLSQCRAGQPLPEGTACLIIDSFGLLSSVYRYGTWAYVGGGFGKSVHNTLEAAVYGIPIFFGPEIHKHREVRELVARSSGFILHDQAELAQLLDRFSSLEECQALRTRTETYFAEEQGATEAILSDLFPEE